MEALTETMKNNSLNNSLNLDKSIVDILNNSKVDFSWYLTPPPEELILKKQPIGISRLPPNNPTVGKNLKLLKPLRKGRSDEEKKLYFEQVDILSELYQKSMVGTVCKNILKRLSAKELLRASHVSRTWQTIIRVEDMRSARVVSRYLRKMKADRLIEKENNCSKTTKKANPKPSPLLTTPLSTPLIDIGNISGKKLYLKDDDAANTPQRPRVNSSDSYQQCPQCQSPAKHSKRTQKCFCAKCNTSFCKHCFYSSNTHSPTCHVVGGKGIKSSPNKLYGSSRRYSIGAKENKLRLKRI